MMDVGANLFAAFGINTWRLKSPLQTRPYATRIKFKIVATVSQQFSFDFKVRANSFAPNRTELASCRATI